MKMPPIKYVWLLLAALSVLFTGCQAPPTPTPTPTTPVTYSLPQLKYRLIAHFGGVFWCDSDYYPIAREGQEQKNAIEQFPTIKADRDEFAAILEKLKLPDKADYTDAEKLLIYREHKLLTRSLEVSPSTDVYRFVLRVGEGQGERIDGTITASGVITVSKREPSFNTCPICLAEGTLIDTPEGAVPVEQLRQGMSVWTQDSEGKRVAGVVLKTAMTLVPPGFQVAKITLSDGRSVSASPGHPTAAGRALGEYQMGERLDGAIVISAEKLEYNGGATYDLLPSGGTGLYWANGILLKSTLAGTGSIP